MVLAAVAVLATTRPASLCTRVFLPTRRQALAVAGVLLVLVAALGILRTSEEQIEARLEKKYPVRAVAFVKEQGYSGPLYNDYNWGGYLMWQMPELPVAMDGRANLHGDRRLEQAVT